MNKERPKDLIDVIQETATKNGDFQSVDEDYYASFLDLTPTYIERLTIVIMLNHEKEMRRLSGGRTDAEAIKVIAQFVAHVLHMMSIGLGALDGMAAFGVTARVGPEPSTVMSARLLKEWDEPRPMIDEAVARFLPWLLAQQGRQGQLPI